MLNSSINIKVIIKTLGGLIFILSLFMLSCLPWSFYYGGSDAKDISIAAAITGFTGLFFLLITRNITDKRIGKKEGYIIVTCTWIIISLFGALPYYINGYIHSFTDCFFETMSGYTTTGSTILSDIESMPKGILFWRSLTHWIGGMGIVVLSVAILPMLGIGGMQLFGAESSGITKDKLHPKIKVTAKRLWFVYIGLTIAEIIFLLLGKMSLYDSMCQTFATVSTGGFSTKNDSAQGFSPYIQYVITLFMLLSGISFTTHFFLATRNFKGALKKNDELYLYLKIIGISILIITLTLFFSSQFGFEQSFRNGAFQVVSIITATGFVSSDYMLWNHSIWIVLFILLFIGGCTGSTSGGLKIARLSILLRNAYSQLQRMVHPRAFIPVKFNGKAVNIEIINSVLAFFFFYMLIFCLGSFFMVTISSLDLETAMSATISCLANAGPAMGKIGGVGNFSEINDAGKWCLSVIMMLGRLELFTVLILLSPSFWKK